MKLLIITQKVDRNDPILGFFHRWIIEFAKHADRISVICLEQGEYDLPQNVAVYSLGKEQLRKKTDLGNSKRSVLEEQLCKVKYVFNFYRLIWRERKNYDAVFVHMNQEYVLLGAPLWKLFGKKVALWRNHHFGNLFTRIAVLCSDKVFCTSKYSFTAQFKKTVLMPVGIDTDLFKRDEKIDRTPNSILFLGRISPVKNVDIFVDALKLLDEKGIDFIGNIYGDSSEVDDIYYKKIKKMARTLEDKGKVIFHGAVPNHETPKIYNQNEIFVNLTESGSFDKTILEASACECLVVVSNRSLKDMLSEQFLFKDKNTNELAKKLQVILSLAKNNKEEYRKTLRQHATQHDLSTLASVMFSSIKK